MKLSDGYVLRRIHGTPHLLPVGQHIAMLRNGIRLNETAAFLWESLAQGAQKSDLLPLLLQQYPAGTVNIADLQTDIGDFLRQLTHLGFLMDTAELPPCDHHFQIGGVSIGYHGPEALLLPSLLDFSAPSAPIAQYWMIQPPTPTAFFSEEILLRTAEMEISRSRDFYRIRYLQEAQLPQARISRDGKLAYFDCIPPYDHALAETLFHALRFAFLIYAQQHGVFALHSASILYQDFAWLFSAPSGIGKSTHAKLWNTLYQTPTLNGDLNLLRIQNGQATLWGSPWCGTSGIYSVESYPLGGIVLLKQHFENQVRQLPPDEQQLHVAHRLVSPTWTVEMLDCNLAFAGELADCVPVFQLLCDTKPLAAQMMKQYFDAVVQN